MNPTARSYPFTRESVQAISRLKQEPSWMRELRLSAWDVYASHAVIPAKAGIQNTQTGLDSRFRGNDNIELDQMQAFAEPPKKGVPSCQWPPDLQHALDERGDEEGLIIQRDSTILSRAISKEQAKRGVVFLDLDAAVRIVPELVRRYFATQIKPQDGDAALHTALWSGGTFLYVPANVKVMLPFHTCVWMSSPGLGVFPHTCIIVEDGSDVSFVDEMLSPTWEDPGFSIGATELWVGDRARLQYFNLQNWGKSICHLMRQESKVGSTGQLLSLGVTTGGSRLTSALRAELLEIGLAHHVNVSQTFSLSQADYLRVSDFFDGIFTKLPPGAMVEKLRHFIIGKYTGKRPVLTLDRVAQLHPEVRT